MITSDETWGVGLWGIYGITTAKHSLEYAIFTGCIS